MRTHTAESQETMTPEKALQFLIEGNERFQQNLKANRNLLQQVNETSEGQFPFAAVLSCIDSRTSAELVFDQGLGDIFSIRIAGNFVNEDILGSIEYACGVAGSKLVVVLGHTRCGAVTAACGDPASGNIEVLLQKIRPAVAVAQKEGKLVELSPDSIDKVAEVNVLMTIERLRQDSPKLAQLEADGKIGIVGAMYDVSTGSVSFLSESTLNSPSEALSQLMKAKATAGN